MLPVSISLHLGLPLRSLLFQGIAQRDKRGKRLLRANRSHPAQPPACQRGRKSNKGPRPGSTAPAARWLLGPRDRVLLVPARRGERVGMGPSSCPVPRMAPQPCSSMCLAYGCRSRGCTTTPEHPTDTRDKTPILSPESPHGQCCKSSWSCTSCYHFPFVPGAA